MSILPAAIDERFFKHRLRSTSLAGVIGGMAAVVLFAYRYYINHIWSSDLLAIALTIAGVKMAAMVWYYFAD